MSLWNTITAAALLVGCTIGATSWVLTVQYERELATARSITRISDADLQEAFDKGMGAGVEYQTWFCENEPVVAQ